MLNYHLVSKLVVKNFREDAKPRDALITETFGWPSGAIMDWNYSPLYLDCLKLRRRLDKEDNYSTFSD